MSWTKNTVCSAAVFPNFDNFNNYYLECIPVNGNGNENTARGTQCHDKNNMKIVDGSDSSSRESYTELPQATADAYTQLHQNNLVSKPSTCNVLFWA